MSQTCQKKNNQELQIISAQLLFFQIPSFLHTYNNNINNNIYMNKNKMVIINKRKMKYLKMENVIRTDQQDKYTFHSDMV